MEGAASSGKRASIPRLRRQPFPRWLVSTIILAAILGTCSYVSALTSVLVVWAQFGGLTYAQTAPLGWTNVTLRGQASGMQYAISQNEPGVIMACGDLQNGYQDTTACWRTTDGGAHWQTVRAGPFQNAPAFQLAAPRDAGQTFFAVEDNGVGSAADTIWVTHDAGQNWRRVTTLTLDYDGVFREVKMLSTAFYRNGALYALLIPNEQLDIIPKTFVVSRNDGATWAPTEQKPSALEQQGWGAFSLAADYRAPDNWYRTMEREGPGVYLEHTTDDGRSWQTVSQITSAEPAAFARQANDSLATTSARPTALCATAFEVGLVASDDGGRTWRAGVPSSAMTRWQGDQTGDAHMGADGACYASYDHQFTPNSPIYKWLYGLPEELALLQLAPHANQITEAPLPTGYSDGYNDNTSDLFAYVPAGHGMSARLVLQANTSESSWFSAFSGADPTSINILIWRSVP